MAGAYWDTSAVAKIFLREPSTQQATQLYVSGEVISSALLPLEMHSVAARRRTESRMGPGEWRALMRLLAEHRRDWTLLAIGPDVLARGEQLLSEHELRSLDAIHLASALLVAARQDAPLRFITADRRQAAAAEALGLALEWLG